jgi:hypothetical protein
LIHPVFAIVAFHGLARFRIPLRGPPGAGGNATLATHAEGFFHKDDSILRSFLHGPGGTGRNAPWIFALKAGYKDIGCPGEVVNPFGADGNNLAETGANGKIVFCLAVRFATEAPDTILNILIYIIFAHESSSKSIAAKRPFLS